jgi:hypothetical protein
MRSEYEAMSAAKDSEYSNSWDEIW